MASKYMLPRQCKDTFGYEDDEYPFINEDEEGSILKDLKEIYGIPTSDETIFKQEVASDEKDEQYEKKLEEEIDKLNDKDQRSCANCAKHTRVECPSMFKAGQHIVKPGDHLKTYIKSLRKQVCPYDHHMIVKKVGKISKDKAELVLIHFTRSANNKIEILETNETFDLTYDEVYLVEYCYPLYSADKIVQRAEQVLQHAGDEKFEKYSLISRNCEHFATWCVIGRKESSQVQSFIQTCKDLASTLFGPSSAIVRGIGRVLLNSVDEISNAFSKAFPSLVLSGIAGLYLVYCIIMTAVNIKRYRKDKELCLSCLKQKLLGLWLSFGVFGLTSGIQLIFFKIALPLIPSPFGIPLVILLILLSIGIQKSVPSLLKILQSPIFAQNKEIENIDEIEVGDLLELKYYALDHIVLVTEVHRSKVRAIHYAARSNLINLFEKRKVREDYFDIDLNKSRVNKKRMLGECYPPLVAVERARKRLGETKFDVRTGRSSHLCNWAKVDRRIKPEEFEHVPDKSKSSDKSSLQVEKREVHLVEELEKGDVVIIDMLKDKKGIILDIKGSRDYGITLELMVHTVLKVYKRRYDIDLKTERLYVYKYLAGHCKPMSDRVETALQMEGNWRIFPTENKFIEACIMLNH